MPPPKDGTRKPGSEHAHRWRDDVCVECRLQRRETWTLDPERRAVLTLMWTSPSGKVLRVRPFPVMLGLEPPAVPLRTVEESFPGVKIGKEPKCPHRVVDWDDDDPQEPGAVS